MRRIVLAILLVALVVFLLPSVAFAWGPLDDPWGKSYSDPWDDPGDDYGSSYYDYNYGSSYNRYGSSYYDYGSSYYSSPRSYYSYPSSGDVWVNGYYRSSGTYVQGYYRSSPDSNPYNNYSFPGNYNPYTGKYAGGSADTYLRNYYWK